MITKMYIPILKAKEAEYKAFTSLSSDSAIQSTLVPLFEVLPNDKQAVEDHLKPVAVKLKKHLAAWPLLFVELGLVDDSLRTSRGLHPLAYVFDELRIANLKAAPVTGVRRSGAYQKAVAQAAAKDGRGMCLRISADDLCAPDLSEAIEQVIEATKVPVSKTHVVLDFEYIGKGAVAATTHTAKTLIVSIPYINQWASVTFAGTGFPESLSGIQKNSAEKIERTEWRVWQSLRASPLPRTLGFGDYGISNPKLVDVDPRIMAMSASIRYTANGDWLCLKGRSVKTHGFGQYHDLSAALVKRPEYAGRVYSDGDAFISDCASRLTTTGNATTWRWVGNVHHLTTVARQLASLRGS